jgi:putative transposase
MAAEVGIKKELIDELLAGRDAKTVFEQDGLLDELKKALAERILNAELDHHLGQDAEQAVGNVRNGSSPKTVLTDSGKLELAIPRDRQGRFEPALIAKYQRRFPGFDQKVIALYARGMSTRDIQAHLRELYGIEISPELVSAVTDAVLDEVAAWQARPLEPVYAIRLPAHQDSRRRGGQEQGGVPGDRRALLGSPRGTWHLDRTNRRRQVLVAGDDRDSQPRHP